MSGDPGRALVLCLCLIAGTVAGEAAAQAFTGAPWNWVRGEAADLTVAPSGEVYAAGKDGSLWQWVTGTREWKPLPGSAARLAAAPANQVWIVGQDGSLERHGDGRPTRFDFKARDVAADPQGNVYVVLADGGVARLRAGTQNWEQLPAGDARAARVAAHPDGSAWVVREDGTAARFDGQAWQPLPGRFKSIAIAANGAVSAADTDGNLQRWSAGGGGWQPEPGATGIETVEAAPDGTLWIADAAGAIRTQAAVRDGQLELQPEITPGQGITFRKGGQRAVARAGGNMRAARAAQRAAALDAITVPARITDTSPFQWIDTLGTAADLAIGQDGSVFAIGLDRNFYRWSNQRRAFLPFPGTLVQIAVEPGGNPWGVNPLGRIFHHDGSDWRQLPGTAADIGIGADGTVIFADPAGALNRLVPGTFVFQRIPGQALAIAVEPKGTPWGLLQDGTVVRCALEGCRNMGRQARSIAIGPDGSVFIVSPDLKLQRFVPDGATWEIISVNGLDVAAVAVGPKGRPWVILADGRVFASAFFPRDESTDLQMSAGTQTPTTGTGDSIALATPGGTGFQFGKNMQFQEFPVGMATTDDLSVGPDGTGIAIGDSGSRFQRFNPKTRAFENMTTVPQEEIFFRFVKTDPDGKLWFLSFDYDGRVYRQKTGNSFQIIQMPVVNPVPPLSPGINRDLAIGPDGAVYAIDTAGTLYRMAPDGIGFVKFISGVYRKVAVTRANDVWVIDGSNLVRQVVGKKADRRPPNKDTVASDLGGGADGSLYIIINDNGTLRPARWNSANRTFDKVTQPADRVEVAPNGRPWIENTTTTGSVFIAR